MQTNNLTSLARAVALCCGVALSCGAANAAGDKTAYDQANSSAKAAYGADKKACGAMKGNANDICVAEAKAKEVRTQMTAQAAWKDTPAAREHATHEIAEADYKVAKERCDDLAGNAMDVCMKEAKAAMTKTQADAKAGLKSTDARADASKDKMNADYKVAEEKCDALAGEPKSACVAAAKANFGK